MVDIKKINMEYEDRAHNAMARASVLFCIVSGMNAENQYRANCGQQVAYHYCDYIEGLYDVFPELKPTEQTNGPPSNQTCHGDGQPSA